MQVREQERADRPLPVAALARRGQRTEAIALLQGDDAPSRAARLALIGMIAVSLAYLAGATIWRPDLWGDPLGPLMKVWPAAILALAALAIMDER